MSKSGVGQERHPQGHAQKQILFHMYIPPLIAVQNPSINKFQTQAAYFLQQASVFCTSQQILDINHKKIYNKKLSVSQISVRNATCDIELASDSLTNKLDAVH